MMTAAWLFIVVCPASFGLGWWLSQRQGLARGRSARFDRAYFKGLNYLINEEADKAVDVLIGVLNVDKDTLETHLALGDLFRRRGEVSRAIRIHRNVIARPDLSAEFRRQALLALAKDYLSAGLLDRAEGVLQQLFKDDPPDKSCLEHLLMLYQRQKSWHQAVEVATLLHKTSGQMAMLLSQLYCELAEQAWHAQPREARRFLKQAEKCHSSDRTSLLRARMMLQSGMHLRATVALSDLAKRSPYLMPVIFAELREGWRTQELPDQWSDLHDLMQAALAQWPACREVTQIAGMIQRQLGSEASVAFLVHAILHAQGSVAACMRWLDQNGLFQARDAGQYWQAMLGMAKHSATDLPAYRCRDCGLSSVVHRWYCPGCQGWGGYREWKLS